MCMIFIVLFVTIIASYPVNSSSINQSKICKTNSPTNLENTIYADLKIQVNNGDWSDQSISTKVGDTLNFKIDVQTETDYEVIAIKIELPMINNQPMFLFTLGTVNPKPDFFEGEGLWFANNTVVGWAWFDTEETWSKTMTFSAEINKPGFGNIDLTVVASKENDNSYDEAYDSISFSAEKDKYLHNLKSDFKNPISFLLDFFKFINMCITHRLCLFFKFVVPY